MRILTCVVFLVSASGFLVAQAQSNLPPDKPATATSTSANPQAPPFDPLLDPPPLPRGQVALIGGSVAYLDPVLNRMTLRPFGDKHKLHIAFDSRTRIFEDGKVASESSLQTGQRVYVDTILNGTAVFARSIQIESAVRSGTGRGQIIDYDGGSGNLTLRDELSNQPIQFQVSHNAVIRSGNETRNVSDLVPGALVSLTFGSQQNRAVVEQISLLAKPGSNFTFYGKITFVDMSRKVVAIDNQNDDKNYEIHLTSIPQSMLRNLHENTLVEISAIFDGTQYVARNLSFPGTNTSAQQ